VGHILLVSSVVSFILSPLLGIVVGCVSFFQRRTQDDPLITKPLFGGIPLLIALSIALFWSGNAPTSRPDVLCIGTFVLAGTCKDVLRRDTGEKFLLPGLAAMTSLLWIFFYPLDFSLIPMIVWFVFIVCAFHRINDLEGHAILFAMLFIAWKAYLHGLATFDIALLGICLGFLPYNLYKTSLHLGDSGTYFLGSSVALIMLPENMLPHGAFRIGNAADLTPIALLVTDAWLVRIRRSDNRPTIPDTRMT
jgi:UDP-N-acetylmuramyl pentapeptide phosphotransferase/UDP-N-acetylglucosamine-1-phosphate transferase